MADGYTTQGKVDVKWWVTEVEKAKKWRDDYTCRSRWEDWRKWYRGRWNPTILPSNLYFKMIRTLVPRVYFRNPSVSITPKKPGWDTYLLAKLMERADNTLLDNMGMKEQMKRAVQYTTMFGTSGLRLGYGAEYTPTPDAAITEDPDTGTKRIQKRVEYNDLVHPNAPWALAAHPGNTIVPAGATDIHSARWVVYETSRTIDDVLDDPRYTTAGRNGLKEGLSSRPRSRNASIVARRQQGAAEMTDGVTLWEGRDKKTGLVFVIAPYSNSNDKILYQEVDDLQIRRRVNYYPLIFNTDDEVFWGVPDSLMLEPLQMEKNEIRTQIMYHRRALLKKLLYQDGAIGPDEVDKLTADDNTNIAVKVKDINGVKVMEAGTLPPGLVQAEQLVDHDAEQLLGLGVNQFGEYAPGSADRSATEANIVNQATAIRVDERRDACADCLVYVVSDMNHIIAERWDKDMILQVAGPGGVQIWVEFSPSLFRDVEYDVKVDPDTSVPLTKQLRDQKAQLLMATYKNDPMVDQYKLRQFHLSEQYGVDADFILMPQEGMPGSQQNPMQLGQAAQMFQQMGQGGAQARTPMAAPVPLQPTDGGRRAA